MLDSGPPQRELGCPQPSGASGPPQREPGSPQPSGASGPPQREPGSGPRLVVERSCGNYAHSPPCRCSRRLPSLMTNLMARPLAPALPCISVSAFSPAPASTPARASASAPAAAGIQSSAGSRPSSSAVRTLGGGGTSPLPVRCRERPRNRPELGLLGNRARNSSCRRRMAATPRPSRGGGGKGGRLMVRGAVWSQRC